MGAVGWMGVEDNNVGHLISRISLVGQQFQTQLWKLSNLFRRRQSATLLEGSVGLETNIGNEN